MVFYMQRLGSMIIKLSLSITSFVKPRRPWSMPGSLIELLRLHPLRGRYPPCVSISIQFNWSFSHFFLSETINVGPIFNVFCFFTSFKIWFIKGKTQPKLKFSIDWCVLGVKLKRFNEIDYLLCSYTLKRFLSWFRMHQTLESTIKYYCSNSLF